MHDNGPTMPFAGACYDVVALAASAGGLDALSEVLGALPADFPAAVVVVQHVSPRHKSLLARILARHTRLPVTQSADGDRLSAGHVYVAPPDWHLLVEPGGQLSLAQTPHVRYVRPSGDVLFGSVATCCKDRGVAVVLTGGGSNGAAGVRMLNELGGFVIAQDPATAQQPAMPRAAIKTGCVDLVLPLAEIGPAMVRLVTQGPSAVRATPAVDGEDLVPAG
jgi:two-component system chemotaxis response regulator CheB